VRRKEREKMSRASRTYRTPSSVLKYMWGTQERRVSGRTIFKEMMTENFSNSMKGMSLYIQIHYKMGSLKQQIFLKLSRPEVHVRVLTGLNSH
jgi:hypothetical protein